MKTQLKYILLTGALLNAAFVFAQHKPIDTIEYHVVEQANANIANGVKINSNPAIADTTKPSRKVDYSTSTSTTQFPTTYIPDNLQPVKLKGEPVETLQHSLLNIGGDFLYNTAYAEYFYNSLQSRDWDYGIHLNHFSSNYTAAGYGLSSFSYNDINLYGKRYLQNHTLTALFDFDEHVVHDYGYDTSEIHLTKDITRERYDFVHGALQYASRYSDSTHLNHDLKLGYYNYADIYGTTENNIDFNADLSAFVQKQKIDVRFIGQYFGTQDALEMQKAINIGLNPYFFTVEKHWDARIGLKAYLDAVNGGTTILPDLLVHYHVADNAVIIYAGIDGDKQYNSYKSLTTTNPFLQDTVNLNYTITAFHGFAGFTGSITNQLTYDINGSESQVKNMPLFMTDTIEALRNRFTVVYDNVQVINAHADLAYRMKEDLRFTLSADWYKYTSTNQIEAWYHPTLKINLLGEYTLQSKYILRAEVYYVNSQYAPEMVEGVMTAKTLAGYPDLNLGVDYKYSKFFTAFVHLNNLANTAYYMWDNYPTQRFNFQLGVRLTF